MLLIQNTPTWAWLVLAALVVLGARALRPRTAPVWQVGIAPASFALWGLVALATKAGQDARLIAAWASGAIAGTAAASAFASLHGVSFDGSTRRVYFPGSAIPLVRNLGVFGIKYAIAVAVARQAADLKAALILDVVVSGLMAGFFVTWLVRLTRASRVLFD